MGTKAKQKNQGQEDIQQLQEKLRDRQTENHKAIKASTMPRQLPLSSITKSIALHDRTSSILLIRQAGHNISSWRQEISVQIHRQESRGESFLQTCLMRQTKFVLETSITWKRKKIRPCQELTQRNGDGGVAQILMCKLKTIIR